MRGAARGAWTGTHRRRLARVARELQALLPLTLPVACATLLRRWRSLAPSTTASLMRTLRAVLHYRRHPEALVFRAATRTTGAAPIPATPAPVATWLRRIRSTTGPAADAVLAAAAAGGARYSSVRRLRIGDITSRFIIVRQTKTGRLQQPTFYDMPTSGWIRRRLARYIQQTPSTRDWAARPRLFPASVTAAAMAAVAPPRQLRRAVAAEMVAAGGAGAAAETLANSPRTVRAHYCPTPTEGAGAWGARLSRMSLEPS